MPFASATRFALLAAAAHLASGQLTAEGFGAHVEGASVDAAGHVYATHFRGTTDSSFNGNTAGRNVIGRIDASTGETAEFFKGEDSAVFNGMRWHADGQSLFLADVGQNKVIKLDLATMTGTDYCGGEGSTMQGKGAPNDLALSKSGLLFLSGQQWEGSTGGLWLCKPDGSVEQLEGDMARTNGIALSPDDGTLYLTEAVGSPVSDASSATGQRIWKYTVSGDGSISEKTEFFNFASDMASPEADTDSDGMRTDTSGNLYVTRNGKGKVLVLSPEGELLKELDLVSTTYPTNLAFGGPSGKTLYVVGRCADASWGEGDGCAEAIAVDAPGREWAWLHSSSSTAAPNPATTASTQAPATTSAEGAATTPVAVTTSEATTDAPATTTPTMAATTAAPGDGSCSAEWKQCGGETWTGPTCCGEGLTCKKLGKWYSQCVKDRKLRSHGKRSQPAGFLQPEQELRHAPVLLQSSGVLHSAADEATIRSEL